MVQEMDSDRNEIHNNRGERCSTRTRNDYHLITVDEWDDRSKQWTGVE